MARKPTRPKSDRWASASFTSDFRHEFEAERARWLRKRFLWYTGVVGVINLLPAAVTTIVLLALSLGREVERESWFGVVSGLVTGLLYGGMYLQARQTLPSRDRVLTLAYVVIVASGVLQVITVVIGQRAGLVESDLSVGVQVAGSIFISHLFACFFLPWTPRECIRPLFPLLALFGVFEVLSSDPIWLKLLTIVVSPVIALPGAAICWWRHSRFRERFTTRQLKGRYAELRQELMSARQIHESLFPKPCLDGPVRFSYVYEPMRQIGGDYLYACWTDRPGRSRVFNVAVLDVTGHGIPAALTVNRLHGELERIFAENPDTSPGELLVLLNRYVHLTLATHSVYVTALCFRIHPEIDRLEYASGGHPPAYLRAVDGSIERLDSTALVLGATAGHDFQAEPRALRFGPGDALIAYTDGATEARDAHGRYLGIDGIQRVIASEPAEPAGGWPGALTRAVDAHRHGPIADDTLVFEIVRPIQSARVSAPATREMPAAAVQRESAAPYS